MANTNSDIEVDPSMINPSDSDYSSSGYDTSSTSLTSTVNEYVFENGRRYHAYYGTDKNLMPTDESEQDRMDLHHEIVLQALKGELHKAPIPPNPQRILDVGTGTGIWAIDMADKYPSAEVVGMDLSPLQPRWVPPNCRFEVDDAELAWTYPSDSFDFIHFRGVVHGITKWEEVLQEAYRCLRPGGYVELSETDTYTKSDDGTVTEDGALMRFDVRMKEAMIKTGRPAANEELLRTRLEKAGYVDVQSCTIRIPIGPWAKDKSLKKLGILAMLACEQAFHSYGLLAFTKILGMNPREAQALCDNAVAATKNKSIHAYCHHFVAYGRKPDEED